MVEGASTSSKDPSAQETHQPRNENDLTHTTSFRSRKSTVMEEDAAQVNKLVNPQTGAQEMPPNNTSVLIPNKNDSTTNKEETQTQIHFGTPPSIQKQELHTLTLRQTAGEAMSSISDVINNNIIAFRYGTLASITLLTVYGISKTPFFFRYKTVSDIPKQCFEERKKIYGRIIHVVPKKRDTAITLENGTAGKNVEEQPIVCYVRHLSPVGRMLNRAAFDFSMKHSPRGKLNGEMEKDGKLYDDEGDLLKVEIAGIKAPPYYNSPSHLEQEGEWLHRFAENRTYVSCQLLSRRIASTNTNKMATTKDGLTSIPQIGSNITDYSSGVHNNDTAICHVKYRPGMNLFRTDLGESLVRFGRASSLSSGLYVQDSTSTTTIADGSTNIKHLQSDASYMEKLGKAEFEAVKENVGMWGDEYVRERERPDLVEEAEFEASAGMLQRIWRWLRR